MEIAAAHYRRQKALARRTAARIAKLWRGVERRRIRESWTDLLPTAADILASAQATAAAASGTYVEEVLLAAGLVPDGLGRVNPARFAGIASDGRPLLTLLAQPIFRALSDLRDGAPSRAALASGALELDMIVRTQVADAGRTADQVAIVARPQVTGWVRMLELPSCGRCILLAGKVYEWREPFQRHPLCDCRHIPATEDSSDMTTDPRQAFESMTEQEQARAFTKAGAQAIRDGADMARVVNARKGMRNADVFGRMLLITTTRPRGRGRNRGVRLMPEAIYRVAESREDAIRLLRVHGYLI